MKTLLIDGDWNLKRNFKKRADMFARGEHCGGSFGALESIRSIVNNVMPDRIINFWDGIMGGKLRKDMYAPYKENRDKSWEEESYLLTDSDVDEIKKEKYNILQQKIKVKNYLEELCIRQLEVDYVEADDLIALYVKKRKPDEEVIIFSSDHDYYQLITKGVSIIRPSDRKLLTVDNFKEEFGYALENALFLKCFEGDVSDNISGVKGVGFKSIKKYFPKFLEEKYTLDRMLEEAKEHFENKPLKIFEKIMNSRDVLERNRTLMNLKRPFLTEEAKREVVEIANYVIVDPDNSEDRSIKTAMRMLIADGYKQHIFNEDIELFFRPFFRIISKEKEYSNSLLQ